MTALFNLDVREADIPCVEWVAYLLQKLLFRMRYDDSSVASYLLIWQIYAIVMIVIMAGWRVLWPF